MPSSLSRSVDRLGAVDVDGPGTEAAGHRVGEGQDVVLDDRAGLDGVGVEEEEGLEGPLMTGVGEVGLVFFLVDLGVCSW